jgi:hypothetical protein
MRSVLLPTKVHNHRRKNVAQSAPGHDNEAGLNASEA